MFSTNPVLVSLFSSYPTFKFLNSFSTQSLHLNFGPRFLLFSSGFTNIVLFIIS
jgi:hypothetical protein